MKKVILVNETDEEVGTMEKLEAHQKALLHRAFSVFIFNSQGMMLLQQRAATKYHSGGLWTNACCSHPSPGELTKEAASRRLYEELGFTTRLTKVFTFTYRTEFENGLTENEYDHVYTGVYDGIITANKEEVMDFTYISVKDLDRSLMENPDKYTTWFRIAYPELKKWKRENEF